MMFMNLFWILILVAGAIFLFKYFGKTSKRDKRFPFLSSNALDILRERYARGEIDKEEFELRKRDLEAG